MSPHKGRTTRTHLHTTHTHVRARALHVSRLLLAARLTKGQFKAKCSRRHLNKPPESPRASGPLGKPHTCARVRPLASDRLTAVIESPFASPSFHHRPDCPRRTATSRRGTRVSTKTHQQQAACVWASVFVWARACARGLTSHICLSCASVYVNVCTLRVNGCINSGVSVKDARRSERRILLTWDQRVRSEGRSIDGGAARRRLMKEQKRENEEMKVTEKYKWIKNKMVLIQATPACCRDRKSTTRREVSCQQ